MTQTKKADTHFPVHEFIAERWSPYGYADRLVTAEDLGSIFEAARWAPSCFNEQPWNYIVATKDQPEEFADLLSCLVEGNQEWAKSVPVLALGVVSLRFSRSGKPNRHAAHDLGLASAGLTFEATARGLAVHQMGGILPERARDLYGIPEGWEALTALAIGYSADVVTLDTRFRQRDRTARERKAATEFVYGGAWANPLALMRPSPGSLTPPKPQVK